MVVGTIGLVWLIVLIFSLGYQLGRWAVIKRINKKL
jgi:hypothetical protein